MNRERRQILYAVALCLLAVGGQPLCCQQPEDNGAAGNVQEIFREANSYYEATLFRNAVPLYHQLLNSESLGRNEKAKVQLRLAQSYFYTGQYKKIPWVLADVNKLAYDADSEIQALNCEGLYLLGSAFLRLKDYDQAIPAFLRYLSMEDHRPLPRREEAIYALGQAYFGARRYDDAKQQFVSIPANVHKSNVHRNARIYLARISIAESKFDEAEGQLISMNKDFAEDEAMPFLTAFLRGEIAFHRKDWMNAAVYFEQAIPGKNQQHAEWLEDALYSLGWSYLHGFNDGTVGSGPEAKKAVLQKAEASFRQLVASHSSDDANVSLGRVLLLKGVRFGDEEALRELEQLLSEPTLFASKGAWHQALLLQGEAAANYEEKERFFLLLTQEADISSPIYGHAWYLRGVNELEEGRRLSAEGKKGNADVHLHAALAAFDKAIEVSRYADHKLAVHALKCQVQAHYCRGTREGFLNGLSLLNQLLKQHREDFFPLLERPDEVYYLQGFGAAHLTEGSEGETFFKMAEDSLLHCVESYPRSDSVGEALRLLGSLYYAQGRFAKAETAFLELAHKGVSQKTTSEAYFWAALAAERCEGGGQRAKMCRKKVYELYPLSADADEAYFLYFDTGEYLGGKKEPIEHLLAFEQRFPDSRYLIHAAFLLALDSLRDKETRDGAMSKGKDRHRAIELFKKSVSLYDRMREKGQIADKTSDHFLLIRQRALLEEGTVCLTLAEGQPEPEKMEWLKRAEEPLSQLFTDFESPDSPFYPTFEGSSNLSKIHEQGAFLLARCYFLQSNSEAAKHIASRMIEKYRSSNQVRGYYLSKMCTLIGELSQEQQDPTTALQYFSDAEEAAQGQILSTDELLDLWIQESLSLRALNKMDEAMLILSKVVNYNAVSSERLRAMYLRAEIYEEQGRHELAKKQLEATATKGGEWALKAKQKLEADYEYR